MSYEEVRYEKDIVLITGYGKKVQRFFNKVYCEYCHKLIPVEMITNGTRRGAWPTNKQHNDRLYHNSVCQVNHLSQRVVDGKIVKKVKQSTIKKGVDHVKIAKASMRAGFNHWQLVKD